MVQEDRFDEEALEDWGDDDESLEPSSKRAKEMASFAERGMGSAIELAKRLAHIVDQAGMGVVRQGGGVQVGSGWVGFDFVGAMCAVHCALCAVRCALCAVP